MKSHTVTRRRCAVRGALLSGQCVLSLGWHEHSITLKQGSQAEVRTVSAWRGSTCGALLAGRRGRRVALPPELAQHRVGRGRAQAGRKARPRQRQRPQLWQRACQ